MRAYYIRLSHTHRTLKFAILSLIIAEIVSFLIWYENITLKRFSGLRDQMYRLSM